MKLIADRKAVLLLEDGKIFTGHAAGKIGIATGELCFNTGMTGYQEQLKKMLAEVPSMRGLELSSKVSANKPYLLGSTEAKRKVAVLDLGVKKNILSNMLNRDCQLKVFPALTPYEEMKSWKPDA